MITSPWFFGEGRYVGLSVKSGSLCLQNANSGFLTWASVDPENYREGNRITPTCLATMFGSLLSQERSSPRDRAMKS